MSAVSSVRTFGVLVTVMPRACAATTSILSTPLPKLAISRSLQSGCLKVPRRSVGDGRNQHIGGADGFRDLFRRHWRIVEIEPGVEQFAHPGLDRVRQLARDDNERLFLNRHVLLSGGVQTSLTWLFDTAAIAKSLGIKLRFASRFLSGYPALSLGCLPRLLPSLAEGRDKTRTGIEALRYRGWARGFEGVGQAFQREEFGLASRQETSGWR